MAETKFIIGMRDAFFDALYGLAKEDKNVVIITADNGAPSLDKFAQTLPGQFFNVGIAEQQMFGMACGMAFEGKKVYCYAIAPFVTTRVHEFIKLDVCAMNLPIVALGVGAGYAYDIMGPSHHTVEDIAIMRVQPNLKIYSPADSTNAAALAEISYGDRSPQYIRFDRAGIPKLYDDNSNFSEGILNPIKSGGDICVISTGIMVHQAIKIATKLAEIGISAGVIDLCRLKPVNIERLLYLIENVCGVVTLEEHYLAGGLGSIVAEIFVDRNIFKPLLRIGQSDKFVFDYGGRVAIWEKYGLDVDSVVDGIKQWHDRLFGKERGQMRNAIL